MCVSPFFLRHLPCRRPMPLRRRTSRRDFEFPVVAKETASPQRRGLVERILFLSFFSLLALLGQFAQLLLHHGHALPLGNVTSRWYKSLQKISATYVACMPRKSRTSPEPTLPDSNAFDSSRRCDRPTKRDAGQMGDRSGDMGGVLRARLRTASSACCFAWRSTERDEGAPGCFGSIAAGGMQRRRGSAEE